NRGICWFAENDLNWGWNENKPNLDLYREDGAVILRVHLINRPTVIEKPRTITFGLLAAPVKPRMREAGTTKHWWRYRYNRDNYTLLGTCINWLSIGCASSVYPAGKDMYLWEMIARGNQERLSREAIQKVIDHGRRYFEKYYGPKNKRRLGTWSRHVSYNLRSRYGEKMIFYYNRASNRTCEEFHTFKDEWCLQDWRSYPDGNNSPGEIKIVPTDSYIDFALYWYARSFEIGNNKGVYWDNFFIASSFNTEMTDAYRLPDGRIRPAAGIWGLRDLARRTFVLLNERNMLPVTFPHMTSFSPLPMMSFCTLQYDWEWKYGRGDTQDRFSRELILLTTNGELAGAWPVLLGGRGKNQWMHKTYAAVRLLHELDGGGGWQPSWNTRTRSIQPLARPFLRLLKDKPEDLEVYRYWDERPQPAVSGDADVPTIVYTVPAEETVIGVVSYAQEDRDVELRINWEKLGLNPSNTRAERIRIDQLSKEKGKQVCEARPPVLLSINDGKIDFELKKHDIAAIRLIPKD
ncbi:MAG: hypothetical protein KGZ25_09155, partial [Planctomycetes bacterium]|nr:hypothetical protein [Planctomycetota bacterium]